MLSTDASSDSFQFSVITDKNSVLSEAGIRHFTMKIFLLSRLKSRLNLSLESFDKLDVKRNKLKKQVGLFGFEALDSPIG